MDCSKKNKKVERGEGREGRGERHRMKETKKERGEAYLSRSNMLGNKFLLN